MKLYLLRPKKNLGKNDPWEPWYDKCGGMVVRADNARAARRLAKEHGGDETRNHDFNPWMLAKYSTCEELKPTGTTGLVIRDFWSA